jgi:hypothetical protein
VKRNYNNVLIGGIKRLNYNDTLKVSINLALEKIAINMLKEKIDLKFISSVTGFSVDELLILKSTI